MPSNNSTAHLLAEREPSSKQDPARDGDASQWRRSTSLFSNDFHLDWQQSTVNPKRSIALYGAPESCFRDGWRDYSAR